MIFIVLQITFKFLNQISFQICIHRILDSSYQHLIFPSNINLCCFIISILNQSFQYFFFSLTKIICFKYSRRIICYNLIQIFKSINYSFGSFYIPTIWGIHLPMHELFLFLIHGCINQIFDCSFLFIFSFR